MSAACAGHAFRTSDHRSPDCQWSTGPAETWFRQSPTRLPGIFSKANFVEILLAPSVASSYPKLERLQPVALPEQEWLLLGTRVDQVVCGRDATPARIVAPDPRYFALQKLWLAEKPTRNPLKRPKDRRQGEALLKTIASSMPHYRLDDAFGAALPVELAPHFDAWRSAA